MRARSDETGHRRKKSLGAGLRMCVPASPLSHGSNCACVNSTGMRSWMSATNSFAGAMSMVQDFSFSPVSRFFHSSQRPAAVSAGEPSRAVKSERCREAAQSLGRSLSVLQSMRKT
jgi:hypothetical protein